MGGSDGLNRAVHPVWAAACFAVLALGGTFYAMRPEDHGAGAPPATDEGPAPEGAAAPAYRGPVNVRNLGAMLGAGGFSPAVAGNVGFLVQLTALVPWSVTCFLLANGLAASALRATTRKLGGAGTCALLLVLAADIVLLVSWGRTARDWSVQYRLQSQAAAR